MSRPFSYNDENYTVIGNVLFCHIRVDGVKANDNIAEIPPAIYQRLTQNTTKAIICRPLQPNVNDAYLYNIYVFRENGKYYLKTQIEIDKFAIVTAYMFLKDI